MNMEAEMKEKTSTSEPRKKEKKVRKPVQAVLGGDILNKEEVIRLLPFLIFLTLLGLIYISNTYYAEKTIRESNKIQKELKELRYEYITKKSQLMFLSQQSQIAERLKNSGIREATIPPKKIFYTESDLNQNE